ncbi:RNA polymerase-associated protein [Citromicrobium phage vB_CbaS-RXM]|nr:RNA polymerase-associated protein [Citromicrobium phage vB_CbaS-RXM]
MHLEYRDGRYVLLLKKSQRQIARQAGFNFDMHGAKHWYTTDWKRAAEFHHIAVGEALIRLDAHVAKLTAELEASFAMLSDYKVPVPDLYHPKTGEKLDYLPYQKAGIQYASTRKYCLIADPPGLGKTIQAVGIINNHRIQSGIIFCPSGLKHNWKKEIEKWLVDKTLTVGIAEGDKVPDTDFVIINYDIADRNYDALIREEWGIIVCDESQIMSNPKAKRVMAILGKRFGKKFQKRPLQAWKWVFLSGTPITKQPIQLWPIIQHCDPDGLGKDWETFVYRYCDAYNGAFGLVTDGGSNLSELNEKLRLAFMVRRLKKHVLKHLPPKKRTVVLLPEEGLSNLIQTERDAFAHALAALEDMNEEIEKSDITRLDDLDPDFILDQMATIFDGSFDQVGEHLDAGDLLPEFTAYSEARKELGLAKLPMVMRIVERLVDEGYKVLVFAIHKEVIARMYEAWPNSARIVGGMTAKKVEKEKVRFQGWDDEGIDPDPLCDRILLNIKAGGVGHTLTKGTKIVKAELWAVPGDVEQCEDRAHRIGQDEEVEVIYPVVQGTMDARTIESMIHRLEMIESAIDG